MASTKSLLLVGVLLVVVILISSEVAASVQQILSCTPTLDQEFTSCIQGASAKGNEVEDAMYEHSHPGHEGGHGSYPGHGGGGGGGHGGYCRYGCCRGFRYESGCKRCCSHATEAPDAFFEDDVKN